MSALIPWLLAAFLALGGALALVAFLRARAALIEARLAREKAESSASALWSGTRGFLEALRDRSDLPPRLAKALSELRSALDSGEQPFLAALGRTLPPPETTAAAPDTDGAGRDLGDLGARMKFAASIFAAVPPKTEEAAFTLMDKFEHVRSISSRAASAAREAKEALSGQGGHAPVAVTAELSRNAVKAERTAVGSMASHNRKNAKELRAMSQELESGIELLKGIEEITERSRLIAFNMAVEAARIGDKGRGFRVIVGELRSLNERTGEFSRRVSELLGRFKDYNATLVAEMAEGSEAALREVEKGMDAAESAVESLIEASASTDRFAREIAGLAEAIDRDLDGVLESLQFQDITRQMIEGGLAALADARKNLEGLRNACPAENRVADRDARERAEIIRRELLARSKTKGEKEAIMEVRS